MQLEHRFDVPAPVDEAWAVLLDIPRVVPCMPGATLTDLDGDTFSGTVKVRLGPISLLYRGKGRFVEADDAAHRVVLEMSGNESRGSGTAAATVTAALSPGESDTTVVHVITDLTITGRPAQFGRGMLDDVGAKLLGQFAGCLAETLSAAPADGDGAGTGGTGGDGTGADGTGADGTGGDEAGGDSTAVGDLGSAGRAGPGMRSTPAAAAGSGFAAGDDRVFGSGNDAEPIDLLEITGIGALIKRYGPYAGLIAGLAALVWWIRRRPRP